MVMRKRNATRLDPAELTQKAEESLQRTKNQQPWVNYLNTWLINRNKQNGFGEDVEITLIPRGI